jgi:AcrR family transcriptional regulator
MQALAAPPALSPRERQRVETRERLFRAGLDEIRRIGLAAAQVDRIVAAVGVSRGTFYFHYPTKADLLLDWEHRREAEMVARLERAERKSRPLRDALLEVTAFLADLLASADGGLVLDTLAIHLQQASDPKAYLLLGEIERRLAEASARGELRDDIDAHQLAILFLSNVFGFLVARTNSQPPHPSPELLVDVFLSGVTRRASRTSTRAPAMRRATRAKPRRKP